MSGILAYLPRYQGSDTQELVRRGLGSLLDRSVTPIMVEATTGPDGEHGTLVTFCGAVPLPPPPYDEAKQTWLAAPPDGELEAGRYWLGYVNDAKPSAGELQRGTLFDGEPVTLRDGNQWVVPISGFLPKRLTRDRTTGEEIEAVADEHRDFDTWSNAILDLFMSSGFLEMVTREKVVHIPKGLRYAALALAKNYRVNLDVIDCLDLVGGHEAFDVARVACGMLTLERVLGQKKTMASPSQPVASNCAPTCSAAD